MLAPPLHPARNESQSFDPVPSQERRQFLLPSMLSRRFLTPIRSSSSTPPPEYDVMMSASPPTGPQGWSAHEFFFCLCPPPPTFDRVWSDMRGRVFEAAV